MLKLHFSVVIFSGLSLYFRGDYLCALFLCVRVSDYWWCPSTNHLLYLRNRRKDMLLVPLLLLSYCEVIHRFYGNHHVMPLFIVCLFFLLPDAL